jgi:hypothetical protein
VLVLRVAALPRPEEVEECAAYGGCRSWLDLVDPPDGSQAVQLWSDDRIAAEVAAVRDALGSRAAIF